MKKKKLPLFVFVINNILGINLIAKGAAFDIDGNYIEEMKLYDLKIDCNGEHISLSKNQKAKQGAKLKQQI